MVATPGDTALQRDLVHFDILLESIAERALAPSLADGAGRGRVYGDDTSAVHVALARRPLHHLHDATLHRLDEAVVVLEVGEDGPYASLHPRLQRERAVILLLNDDQLGLGAMSRLYLGYRRMGPLYRSVLHRFNFSES